MAKDSVVGNHRFNFDPSNIGGESVSLTTSILSNGEPDGIFINQVISLQSYGNSASINLFSTQITPTVLRELANQLESAILEAKAKIRGQKAG